MPLQTRICRDGKALSLCWGGWHLQVMRDTAILEMLGYTMESAPRELVYDTEAWRDHSHRELPKTELHSTGKQTLQHHWNWRDPADGEVLRLQPGDVLEMWI